MSNAIRVWVAIALVAMAWLLLISPLALAYTFLAGWSGHAFLVVWMLSGVCIPILVCLGSVPVEAPPATHTTRVSPYFWWLLAALMLPIGVNISAHWMNGVGWHDTARHLHAVRSLSCLTAVAAMLFAAFVWSPGPYLRRCFRAITDHGWYPFWLAWRLVWFRWLR